MIAIRSDLTLVVRVCWRAFCLLQAIHSSKTRAASLSPASTFTAAVTPGPPPVAMSADLRLFAISSECLDTCSVKITGLRERVATALLREARHQG